MRRLPLTLRDCTDPALLDTLALGLKIHSGIAFAGGKRRSTIVNDGDTIMDKWKGHGIADKLRVVPVRMRKRTTVRMTNPRILGHGSQSRLIMVLYK
jgi:hypothetical protein